MPYQRPLRFILLAVALQAGSFSQAADADGEAKAKAHYEGRKDEVRKSQENIYRGLAKEVAKVAGLGEKETQDLVTAAQPVVEKGIVYWALVWRLHYLDHYKEEGDSHFWDDFGNVLIRPDAKQARQDIKTAWDTMLSAKLSPEALAKWNTEAESRKARGIKAFEPALKKRTENAIKSNAKLYEDKIADVLADADLDKNGEARLQEGLKSVLQQYEKDYSARLHQCLPNWDVEVYRLASKTLENLEKKGSFLQYLPELTALNNQTQAAFDAMVDKTLKPEEHKRMVEAREKYKQRIAAAAKKMLESLKERQLQTENGGSASQLDSIADTLKLPPERKKAMETKLEEANKAALAEWAKATLPTIESDIQRNGQSKNREQFLKEVENGNWYFHDTQADEKLAAAKIANWDLAVKSALTAEEMATWETIDKTRRERKARSLTKLIVSELDNKVKLLPEQRDKLETLVFPVAQDVSLIPGGLRPIIRYNSLDYILMMLEGVDVTAVNNILDDEQNKILAKSRGRYSGNWSNLKRQIDKLKEKQKKK